MTTNPSNEADWLDEIIDDCTLALTSYTLGPEKVTSYDEIIIDRPKLVVAITTKIAEERLDEHRLVISWHDKMVPAGVDYFSKRRIVELEGKNEAA